MTIRPLYPSLRPTLDLNFAKTNRLDPRITFTRASVGTYVGADGLIKTAVANEPRFNHAPATGESLGLLVEEARTNQVLQSSNISSGVTAWNLSLITSYNAAVAPDGTTTAVEARSSAYNGLRQNVSLSNGVVYTVSVWLKAKSGVTYNDVVTVGADGVSDTNYASTLNSTSQWFRATHTFTSPSTASRQIFFGRNNNGNTTTLDFYAWGPQIEAGAFPTSYIPTVASTVTRSADVASITGSNFSSWYNQSEGTMLVDGQNFGTGSPEAYFFQIDDNSSANFIKISKFGATTYATVDVASAHTFERVLSSIAQGSTFKAGLAYKLNSFAATLNGASPSTSTSGAVPSNLSRLRIGNFLGSSLFAQSTISRLIYWPVRLSDATLQAITR